MSYCDSKPNEEKFLNIYLELDINTVNQTFQCSTQTFIRFRSVD